MMESRASSVDALADIYTSRHYLFTFSNYSLFNHTFMENITVFMFVCFIRLGGVACCNRQCIEKTAILKYLENNKK